MLLLLQASPLVLKVSDTFEVVRATHNTVAKVMSYYEETKLLNCCGQTVVNHWLGKCMSKHSASITDMSKSHKEEYAYQLIINYSFQP